MKVNLSGIRLVLVLGVLVLSCACARSQRSFAAGPSSQQVHLLRPMAFSGLPELVLQSHGDLSIQHIFDRDGVIPYDLFVVDVDAEHARLEISISHDPTVFDDRGRDIADQLGTNIRAPAVLRRLGIKDGEWHRWQEPTNEINPFAYHQEITLPEPWGRDGCPSLQMRIYGTDTSAVEHLQAVADSLKQVSSDQ